MRHNSSGFHTISSPLCVELLRILFCVNAIFVAFSSTISACWRGCGAQWSMYRVNTAQQRCLCCLCVAFAASTLHFNAYFIQFINIILVRYIHFILPHNLHRFIQLHFIQIDRSHFVCFCNKSYLFSVSSLNFHSTRLSIIHNGPTSPSTTYKTKLVDRRA